MTRRIFYNVNVQYVCIKDNDTYLGYIPAFKLYAMSKKMSDLQDELKKSVKRFLKIHERIGNFDKKMKHLGWVKHNHMVQPPEMFNMPTNLLHAEKSHISKMPVRLKRSVATA